LGAEEPISGKKKSILKVTQVNKRCNSPGKKREKKVRTRTYVLARVNYVEKL